MKALNKWGIILLLTGLAVYLIGIISGEFNKWLSIGGMGIILIGDSSLATILLSVSLTCVINAVTTFIVSHVLAEKG